MLDRHDLTDEEWARLEPLLPDRTPRRGGRSWFRSSILVDRCPTGSFVLCGAPTRRPHRPAGSQPHKVGKGSVCT
ncbi:MAG: transposase [Micromonosporaceae bacterium]|nr:transposase [Micromonosporaceae bacterium]